jgi:ADP-ribose pyrophosphatase YjhB (NUDIX family)
VSRLAFPVAAHLLLVDGHGRTLFARRAGTGYADGFWSVPAGHVEPGETLHEACVREAAEEIGVMLAPGALALACLQQKLDTDGQERLDAFFTAALPAGQAASIREPERCDRLEWAKQAPAPVVPYVRAALAHIAKDSGPLAYFGYGRKW